MLLPSNIDTAVFHNNSRFVVPGVQEARKDSSRRNRGMRREEDEVGFMQPSIVSEVCMVSKQMHARRDHRPGARQVYSRYTVLL